MGRGGHLGGAGDEPKLLVESVALGAAGIGVGGERGGGRSSVVAAGRARGHGRLHGWARSAPGMVLSTLPCSGVGYGDSSTVCDIAGGEELSAPTAGVVRRHGRARGERGNGQGLTRGRERSSVGSGKPLQRRIDDGDLRAPEMKTTTLRSTAASSGRVRRVCSSTGSGRSSGMHSGSEGVAGRGVSQRSGHGGFGHEGKRAGK